MTIQQKTVIWDDGNHVLCFHPVAEKEQYRADMPCLTFGISYETPGFKGCDSFALFGQAYTKLVQDIQQADGLLKGQFTLFDMGADTDGYVDVVAEGCKVFLSGQLGLSLGDHSLKFSFRADQTILKGIFECLRQRESD